MKSISALIFLFITTAGLSQDPIYFVSDPTLTPDGSTIYFTYEKDLWMVPSQGGRALRITAMDGVESKASVSPDGKWVAFSSTQLGNNDVYIMPSGGGEIRQLTFHDSNDEVESWAWDSKTIYFTSNRYNRFSTYSVELSGETPKRLFPHYFNNIHNAVEHPEGAIFFNETWESKNFAHRKRYKGAYNPDLKSYNPASDEFKKHTDYEGKDFWATIDQMGNIYFVSDESNGEYNLYKLNGEDKNRLTQFNTSVIRPRVSANGESVVFTKDYTLHLYSISLNETVQVPIELVKNNVLDQANEFTISNNISAFDVAHDKKKIAIVSRGELFVSDIKGKFIKHIPTSGTERLSEVFWLSDSKRILYSKSNGGHFNWFLRNADGTGLERQLTTDTQNNRLMSLNEDRDKAVYLSGRNELRIMNLTDLTSRVLVKDEFWGFYNPGPSFSPDGRYVLYTAIRDFERDLFVFDLTNNNALQLTNTGVTETSPSWSPDGKYIYFSSNLTQASFPRGGGNTSLFRIPLYLFDEDFKSDKVAELFKDEAPKEDSSGKKSKKSKKEPIPEKTDKNMATIDASFAFMDHIERVGPSFGSQSGAYVLKDGEKTIAYYVSNHDEGQYKLWRTIFEPFKSPKTEKVEDERISGFSLVKVEDSFYVLKGRSIHSFNASTGKSEKIDMDYSFNRNLVEEFSQMFYEAWAGFGENYYDENFHGEDWNGLKDQYSKYLPYVTSRADLRRIFNDMLGELNTSHFGFYSFGQEESTFYGTTSIGTGIKFENQDPYLVAGVISDSPAEKSKNILPGDRLIAVNGIRVDNTLNRESYFNSPSMPEEISLLLNRNGQEVNVNLHPVSSGQIRTNLYDEWVDSNQEYVDTKSDNRIAYVHMKNMGGGELQNFLREMVSEGHNRDALILDLRYNTGGNVHDDVLRFLSQKPYMNWKYREGALAPQSNFSPSSKPIVVLINEQSLSDAEVASSGFKELGLGKLIGTETYRWIIFTTSAGLVDGSSYRLPSWGCYSLDGKDLEMSGVSPDITVEKSFIDRLKGNNPQLDKAIEEILKDLD